MNSMQQPIAGEPSYGTPHPHFKEYATASFAVDGGWHTLDLSAEFPRGTNAIYGLMTIRGNAAGLAGVISDDNHRSDILQYTQGNAKYIAATGIVPLYGTRLIDYFFSAALDFAYLRIYCYYI